ncbi:MAG: bifunctional diaminohydroxyphosphoribosylaminopyrimidine deaminase/5-amino-6-(5-phosphoribosylamino)uracil reductase RibD [Pikeienuella sp.]
MAAGPEEDRRWMAAAIAFGRRGLGRVWPNPAVGCVLVRDGRLIGRGWTRPGGRLHAEAAALEQAGDARGATAYVSLEPCAHHGRTPPCAEALIAAGVARVVAPIADPDPRVAGRGFALLEAAGIAVETGLMAAEAEAANEGFLLRQRADRPFLTLKLAATLDGRIATAAGESRWITGPESRARAHLLRAQHDAILIGAATALADNPALDVRLAGLEDRAPLRLALDAALTLPATLHMAGDGASPVWRLHARGDDAAADWGEPVPCPAAPDGRIDLAGMMRALGARGLTRVLCEGGGRLGAALVGAGLVDELVWFSAGAAIGAEGRPALGPLGLARLAEAPRFDLIRQERLGEDLMSIWRPRR